MQSLARVAFFKDVADLDFDRFDRLCHWRKFNDGELVVDYEDESSDVYFIVAGEVRILIRTPWRARKLSSARAGSGQFFGEMTAIDGAKRSANVTALTKSELCIMPAPVFREVIFTSKSDLRPHFADF